MDQLLGQASAPTILFGLTAGTPVKVVFDNSGPAGLHAVFLGITGNTAAFRVNNEIVYIVLQRITAVTVRAPKR